MKLRKALGTLLITAFFVGLFSFGAGTLFMGSIAIESYADIFDGFAEDYYELGDYDKARETRNEATEMRDLARKHHVYGIYFAVGALLILIAGAGWMAWKFEKE